MQRKTSHPDDVAIDKFAAALKRKMRKKRAEGRSGWNSEDECAVRWIARRLADEITGSRPDPVDIGNYAMMLYIRKGGKRALRKISSELCDAMDVEF